MRKHIKIIAIIIACLSLFLLSGCTTVNLTDEQFVATDNGSGGVNWTLVGSGLSGSLTGAHDMIIKSFDGRPADIVSGFDTKFKLKTIAYSMYLTVFSDSNISPAVAESNGVDTSSASSSSIAPLDILRKVSDASSSSLKDTSAFADVMKAIKTLAIVCMFFIWGIQLAETVINERFNFEALIKSLMQLMIGLLVVNNAELIVSTLIDLGVDLIPDVSTTGTNIYGAFETEVINDILNSSITLIGAPGGVLGMGILEPMLFISDNSFTAILLLLLPYIATLICSYQIISVMIVRVFELIARIIFAPLPISLASRNGFGPGAIEYVKATAACALQPVFIAIGCVGFSAIQNLVSVIFPAETTTGLIGSVAVALSFFVLSTYISKTGDLAQKIIGR